MVIKIIEGWKMPFGFGLTLGQTVYVNVDSTDIGYVIAHEVKHTEQYKELGTIGFLYTYFKELFAVGYMANKLEVEAREAGALNRSKYTMREIGTYESSVL